MTVDLGSENILERYRKLTGRFAALGHKAEVMSLCEDCAKQYSSPETPWFHSRIVFAFTAKGSTESVYSFPSNVEYNDFEYRIALAFLKGTDTIDELTTATKSKLNSDVYLKHIRGVIGDGK